MLVAGAQAHGREDHFSNARVIILDRRALVADTLSGALVTLGVDAVGRCWRSGTEAHLRIPPGTTAVLIGAGFPWAALAPWLRRQRTNGTRRAFLMLLEGGPPASVRAATAAGLSGWLDAAAPLDHLLAALRAVHTGQPWFPRLKRSANAELGRLTAREQEVLLHLAAGKPDAAIADAMQVSPHTVRTHVQNVRAKLGVANRFAAVTVARRARLLSVPGEGE